MFYLFKVVEIVRAFRVYTFMDTEEFTVFLGNQSIATVRTCKSERCGNNFTGRECLTTDFALILTVAAIVVVDVMMWSTT